jgi:hypothetical protein
MSRGRAEAAQTEVSALLTLLDDCGPGEPLAPVGDREMKSRDHT